MNTRLSQTAQNQVHRVRAQGIFCNERNSALDCRDVSAAASSKFLPESMAQQICSGEVRVFVVTCPGIVKAPIELYTCNGREPSHSLLSVLVASIASLETMLGNCPCSGGVRVFLLAGKPRTKKDGTGPLLIDHINSGFSYIMRDRGHVVVFRCVEAHRTLVHELMHVWGIHGNEDHHAQMIAATRLGAPSNVLLSEAFVEAMTWLLMRGLSPSTTDAEEMSHSLTLARQYMACACDDGTTNAWSYIMGRALLIADGGGKLCAFLSSGARGARPQTLHGASSHIALVDIMCENAAKLPQHKEPHLSNAMPLIRMVKSDWGGAFE